MGEDRKTTKQASKILNIIQFFWCLLTLKMNIFWKFSDLSLVFVLQWVQDGSPSKSTPIKVESPNQFVPLGTTKKEFKRIQAAVNIYFQSFNNTVTLGTKSRYFRYFHFFPIFGQFFLSSENRPKLYYAKWIWVLLSL